VDDRLFQNIVENRLEYLHNLLRLIVLARDVFFYSALHLEIPTLLLLKNGSVA
jgi:hypothetical protein